MKIFSQVALMWKFFGIFLTPFLRVWHLLIVVLVTAQILKIVPLPLFSSWHGKLGLYLFPIICIFLFACFKRRGFRYFFPYFWGETAALGQDLQKLKQGTPPPPRPGGLSNVVKGLGLTFLMATVTLGFVWYVLRVGYGHNLRDLLFFHKGFAFALIGYMVVHGSLSLWSFANWQKKMAK